MTALTQTVRELALEHPQFVRVFEQYGIDYCCGGRMPLAEACAARNISSDELLSVLKASESGTVAPAKDWAQAGLRELIAHIVSSHHAYVKRELPRLAVLAQKVVHRHGETQAHLPALQGVLAALDDELTHHLAKEENILFPYIASFEAATESGNAYPEACFGTVANPIAMMTSEHDNAGALLVEIERLSNHFTTPEGACPTYHAFCDGLKEFQQDLHQHIHLENNILFPRAILLEAAATRTVT